MALRSLTATGFRCFSELRFEPDPGFSLITGPNASGKTSVLEAVAYLALGRSFRGAPTTAVIRHGESELTLFGEVGVAADPAAGRVSRVGVRNGAAGLEVRIDGTAGNAAGLAELLPTQVIDPEVHELVAGGPERRRRFLDWVVFHVEPGFLAAWRRYRRALKQRNAALRKSATNTELDGWDTELVEAGLLVDAARRRALERVRAPLERQTDAMLGAAADVAYQQGWPGQQSLAESLVAARERDRTHGNSHIGPHRADLRLRLNERLVRRLVSRGQQKLLASAMVLAAAEGVREAIGRAPALLIDDPAAELDEASLDRLMGSATALGGQLIVTSLRAALPGFPSPPRLFHVEQGVLRTD